MSTTVSDPIPRSLICRACRTHRHHECINPSWPFVDIADAPPVLCWCSDPAHKEEA